MPRSWRHVHSTDACDSCYVTQTVVFVYFNLSECVDDASLQPGVPASPPPGAEGQTQQQQQQQPQATPAVSGLAGALVNATASDLPEFDWDEGYVLVTMTYRPYNR